MKSDDPFIPDRRLRAIIFISLFGILTIVGFTDIRLRSRPIAGQTMNDFTVYWIASRAMASGQDPYDVANPRGSRYIYPPFLALAIRPLTILPAVESGVLWYFFTLLLAWRCYEELGTIVKVVAPDELLPLPGWLAVAPILAIALPGFSCLQGGQVGILMLWAMLVALRLVIATDSRQAAFGSGLLLAAAISIKLTPALPAIIIIFHLAMLRMRDAIPRAAAVLAGLVVGAFAFLLVIPSTFLGWHRNEALLGEFIDRIVVGHLEMGIHQASNQSLWFALTRTIGDARIAHPAAILLGSTSLILLGAALVVLKKMQGALPLATSFGLAAAATLEVSPISWAHHFVFLTPALLFVPLTLLASGHARSARFLAFAPIVIAFAHYATRIFFPGTAILGIGVALWLIAAEVVIVATGRLKE